MVEASSPITAAELSPVSVYPIQCTCLGGRLARFQAAGRQLTTDAWVLQTVQGFHVEFYDTPRQVQRPRPISFSTGDARLVDDEVTELLRKGAICHAELHPRGFLSNFFLVDKADGGRRPVINLKEFNGWLVFRHFKMERIHLLRDILQQSDWMVRLDLKDVYLVIPIHPPHRCFLQFLRNDQVYEFTALPFGLSLAPCCFTKVLHPVVEFLRAQGLRMIVYLDDILIMAQSPSTLLSQLHQAVTLMESLGFVINSEKSVLTPSQTVTLLGFVIDSVDASLSLPSRKMAKIRHELRQTLSKSQVPLRQIARVVGLLSFSI